VGATFSVVPFSGGSTTMSWQRFRKVVAPNEVGRAPRAGPGCGTSPTSVIARDKQRPRERLIVALDVSSASQALRMTEKLRGHVGVFKVGSQLFTAEGPAVARQLVALAEKVFLDLKFHDIPNTVHAAAREAARMGVTMLDVHASGGRKMMEAALEGSREGSSGRDRPLVLAITVLTSLGTHDLAPIGVKGDAETAAIRLARLAQVAGLDGVVASPLEIAAIRRTCGPNFLVVTPGIRLATAVADDQTRIATPEQAIRAGADYLVVGRLITAAEEPALAADAIVAEMEKAARAIA
jgi:orotidine-5'-phosphate decarboxylase